jgi:hypothetical protein
MSYRSSTSSFRRSLVLGALLCALAWTAVEAADLPRTGFYAGRKVAEKFVRLAQLERQGPVDVFILGPSYVDQAFDAGHFGRVTGTRAFNMGVQGTDIYYQSILLRQMLLLERAPAAILWSMREDVATRSNINRQYVGSAAVAYATGPGGRWAYTLGQILPQFHRRRLMDWVRELSVPMRRFTWESARGDARASLRSWIEPLDEFGRTQLFATSRQGRRRDRADGAEREAADDGAEEDTAAPPGSTRFMTQDFSIDIPTAKAHVVETLRLLRARGIAVWFFFTPYYESVLARSSKHSELLLTGANEHYYAWLRELSAEFEIPIVDLRYCAEITNDARFFFDSRHLNNDGAIPLAEIMGEIYSGKRPLPEVWNGVPSRAQYEYILGKVERERVPRLSLGQPHGLDAAHGVRHDGLLTDLYAVFRIERPARVRVALHDAEAAGAARPLYVRLGGPHYERWTPPDKPRRSVVVLETRLEPGEHLLELHSADTRQPIDWDQLLVEVLE